MRKVLKKLLDAVYFVLCYAPVALLLGYLTEGDGFELLLYSLATIPAAFVISLLPGTLGGKKKQQDVFTERRTSSDPDPDRSLRRDTHEDDVRQITFPLRAVICGILMLAIFLYMIVYYTAYLQSEWPQRIIQSAVPAAMLPLALRFCALGQSSDGKNAIAGIVIYLAAGIVGIGIQSQLYTTVIALAAGAFIITTLWIVNDRAMHQAAASRQGIRPPKQLVRRNRVILSVIVVLTVLIAEFSWLKEKAQWLFQSAVYWIVKIINFITDLFMGGQEASSSGGGGGMDMDMSALGPVKTSAFWEKLTYVGYVIAAVGAVLLLYWFLRNIYRLVKKLSITIGKWLGRFAHSVGEDYSDEQESLLSWGNVQKEMSENIRKRVKTMFARDKKWEDMDADEKARFIVRVLYRRAKIKADPRTIREIIPQFGTEHPDDIVSMYETARYSAGSADAALIERLRKENRV